MGNPIQTAIGWLIQRVGTSFVVWMGDVQAVNLMLYGVPEDQAGAGVF